VDGKEVKVMKKIMLAVLVATFVCGFSALA
jgi:hypothetical protein